MGLLNLLSRPRSFAVVAGVWMFAGCGDDARESESADTGVGPSGPTVDPTGTATTGASEATPTSGTLSATEGSASATESSGETATSGTTTAMATASSSGGATDSETSEGPGFCGEDPPKGYVGPFNADCKAEPQVGTFAPVLEWNKQTWMTDPTYKQVLQQPVVAPLTDDDGDGVYGSAGDLPAVVVVTYSGSYDTASIIRAVSGDGATELLTIKGQAISGASGLAVGDLDGDAAPEIVAVTTGGAVRAFDHDGALKWTSAAYPADYGAFPLAAAPAIGDMNADGKPEVVVGRVILNGQDGTLLGKGKFGVGRAVYGCASFPADIDGDGLQEVVVGNALYRIDGTAIWSTADPDGYPAIADFDADGKPEIVVAANGKARLHRGDGTIVWDVANPALVGGPPTIADYDGDGQPEVGIAGKTGYIVFDTDGAVLWTAKTQDASSSTTGSSVYDFEGDGIADVVYADEYTLWVFSGNDGTVKLEYKEHSNGTLIEYPIVVDVDNDGEVEIVVTHNNTYWGAAVGISVLGDMNKSWRPGRKIWNQHAYNITNVGDDAKVPAVPEPNWPKYNSFRSGDLSANDGLAAPDLQIVTPEGCVNECTGPDQVKLWFQLGNTGAAPLLGGAEVEVYGTKLGVETLITTVPAPGALQPGEFADAQFVDIATKDLEQLRLVAVSKEIECAMDMGDEVLLMPPFCSAPG